MAAVTFPVEHRVMNTRQLSAEQTQWVVARALAGADPDSVLAPLRAEGWDEQAAIDAVSSTPRWSSALLPAT